MKLDVERLEVFWRFVYARQSLYENRRKGFPPPWTADPVLAAHRFTNVYRAEDRVSQYLIKHVLYGETARTAPEEQIFRALLFRLFNQIETYEALRIELGAHPNLDNFSAERYFNIILEYAGRGMKVWNNAYMITPPPETYGAGSGGKVRGWLNRLAEMIADGALAKIEAAPALEDVYDILHSYATVGDFFAMQWTTDINYSTAVNFDENDFIVPGPGARRGAAKLFAMKNVPDALLTVSAINFLTQQQLVFLESLGMGNFPWLGGSRTLHLIDVQNCLCEFSKWTRVAKPGWALDGGGDKQIKQGFTVPVRGVRPLPEPFYPPKWNLVEGNKR